MVSDLAVQPYETEPEEEGGEANVVIIEGSLTDILARTFNIPVVATSQSHRHRYRRVRRHRTVPPRVGVFRLFVA